MAYSNHQQIAIEFIQLLSVYPTLIPNGSSDDGTPLAAALSDDLHEFATQMGVAASIHWHKPEHNKPDQIAIQKEDLAYIMTGAKHLSHGLQGLKADMRALQGDRDE